MRFISEGPILPDRLLAARDAGQVLLFCGAGVSQADAGLPDFASLSERVLTRLGSALTSPARRLFDASQSFEKNSGLAGVVATDRIFGLLEQEFDPAEVREAVAIELRPRPGYGLDAHRILLDLSRTQLGVAKLITTNFDPLFEESDPMLKSSYPPYLPDLRREQDFQGVIHLHGRVDADYRCALGRELILSSADFGRAYLSDGWAARYVQELLERFVIVFVGYSANDPPVQYLLEALRSSGGRRRELYAFQAGDVAQASGLWAHKGVDAIVYDSARGHVALWDTLRAWAGRARDVDGWHRRLIKSAVSGPEKLQPFERGMLAHLAATVVGARHLAVSEDVLPPSWLCVLDPRFRYGRVGQVNPYDEMSPRFDPFDAFGLDSDDVPAPMDAASQLSDRLVPASAWDAFASTTGDWRELLPTTAGRLRDHGADDAAPLPPRLAQLSLYLSRIAHLPATLWWAAHQAALHPDLQRSLKWSLSHESARFPAVVRDGWRVLLKMWDEAKPNPDTTWHELSVRVQHEGWSPAAVREVIAVYRPTLEVKPAFNVRAPEDRSDLQLGEVVYISVGYPRPHGQFPIPEAHLPYALTLLRQEINHGVALECEEWVNGHINLGATRVDGGRPSDEHAFRITGLVNTYANMVVRLAATDRAAANAEVMCWFAGADEVSTRLRIWAAGDKDVVEPAEAADILLSLADESFWSGQHQSDLLYTLRDRWSELPQDRRTRIEARLLGNPSPDKDDETARASINLHRCLGRLQWLQGQGVLFSFDITSEMPRLQAITPGWDPRHGEDAMTFDVGEAYTIERDTNPEALLSLPLCEILEADRTAEGQGFYSQVERNPFRGLAETYPARALAVLTDATRRGIFDPRAWATVLGARGQATSSRRMLTAIGHRLARLPTENVSDLASSVSEWLRDRADTLFDSLPETFDVVWNALISALVRLPSTAKFRRPDANWVNDGLNHPAGRLVDAMLKDSSKAGFAADGGLPKEWRRRFEQLLALQCDHRQHAIAMIAPRLNWLYHIDPVWTEAHLLTLVDRDDADAQALWDGYLWRTRSPQPPLYRRLKPSLVGLVRFRVNGSKHADELAAVLLAGWKSSGDGSGRLLDDIELREILIHGDDDLRTRMLDCVGHWAAEPGSRWGDRLIPFLRDVWPRQRDLRTPGIAAGLADLAFAIPDRFPEIVDAILPRLVPVPRSSVHMRAFLADEHDIASRHPARMLNLLWAILPEDAVEWPYQTTEMLKVLAAAPETTNDSRLAELGRRQYWR